MMSMALILLTISSLYASVSLNPVKVSLTLLMMSVSSFLLMFLKTGTTWMPLIFLMLFMGGILIVFMIVASILPNEKCLKMNKIISSLLTWSTLATLTYILSMKFSQEKEILATFNQIKWFLQASNIIEMSIVVMILYFLGFIMIAVKEKSSLRTSSCFLKWSL